MSAGLRYKEDWEEMMSRYEAWWAGEVLDRVALSVTAPRRPANPPEPRDNEALYCDADYLIRFYDEVYGATYFGGEALPTPCIMLGYAAWGGPARFAPDTLWMNPILGPDDDLAGFRFDWSHEWWGKITEVTRQLAQAARDKYLVGMAAIVPPFDALSFYLGAQQLCTDMLDRPDEVRAIHAHLIDVWKGMCTSLWEIADSAERGYTGWLNVWSPITYAPLQVDFSCMVSKPVFDEFIAPEVQELARWQGHSIYHLDGPGALHHLDTLLSIPELDGIQWVPGEGNPDAMGWIPMLRRIQDAGKLLQIYIDPGDVEQALTELRPEGLLIDTHTSSEAEARELLESAKGWTHARK